MKTFYVKQEIEIDDAGIAEIFAYRLNKICGEWYLAPAEKSKTPSLCHEGEPHPHNGDTSREIEIHLKRAREDIRYAMIIAALEFRAELKRISELKP